MSRVESWETVARALGERMAWHDFCEETSGGVNIGGVTIGDPAHPFIEDGLAVGCPFCKDRDAYRRYQRKVRRSLPPERVVP